jgi:LAS superfamily LD-carboxypeptidase LdcB
VELVVLAVLVAWALASRSSNVAEQTTEDRPPMATTDIVALSTVPGHRLRRDAAAAFDAAVRAAGETPRVTSSTRTREQQAALFELYKAGKGPLAAPPGRSWHEVGLAIDARGGEGWEREMAARGWKRTVSSEPWHWEYRP